MQQKIMNLTCLTFLCPCRKKEKKKKEKETLADKTSDINEPIPNLNKQPDLINNATTNTVTRANPSLAVLALPEYHTYKSSGSSSYAFYEDDDAPILSRSAIG